MDHGFRDSTALLGLGAVPWSWVRAFQPGPLGLITVDLAETDVADQLSRGVRAALCKLLGSGPPSIVTWGLDGGRPPILSALRHGLKQYDERGFARFEQAAPEEALELQRSTAVEDQPPWWARPNCDCIQRMRRPRKEMQFHVELQDTTCDAWRHLVELIEEAGTDRWTEFAPFQLLTYEETRDIMTLPPAIKRLNRLRRLDLYGSFLVRIPREIGDLSALRDFDPYTSWNLHWLPYEITRCRRMRQSRVSTRCLYGNFKNRLSFPRLPVRGEELAAVTDSYLRGPPAPIPCSICDGDCPRRGPRQAWVSLRIGTDTVPLLVNACSKECLARVPPAPKGYIRSPHRGGRDLEQPPPRH
jgi:hypothetical protein